jgi:hypothetical protein
MKSWLEKSSMRPVTLQLPRIALTLVLTLAAAPLYAATPREELLRYVPKDVAFCLILQDLRDHDQALEQSPFMKELAKSPFMEALLQSDDLKNLLKVDQFLRDNLGVDAVKLRDEIFGDALAFAYRPGPPGKPEAEQGLFLLRARDPKLLAELIDRLNELQRKSEDLVELKEIKHHDVSYFRRTERKRAEGKDEHKETNYYLLNGPVLLFSSQEPILRDAIDQEREATSDKEPEASKQFRLAHAEKAFAAFWVNPRAFDAEMQRRANDAPAGEAAILKNLLVYWKALDSIVLTADLQKDLVVQASIRARVDQLPASARKFLSEAAKPSDLWARFPDDAMMAMASRIDLPSLVSVAQEFLPAELNKSMKNALDRGFGATLGRDFLADVLPNIGPDWGMCIVAPASDDKSWIPQSVFALRTQAGDKKPPVDQTVLDAVNFYAGVAVLMHNTKDAKPLSLKSVNQDNVEVKYLTGGDFPEGMAPAFTLHDGYLVLGSSPDAIRRFHAVSPTKVDADNVPLLRVSFKEIRRYLKERREPVIAAVAEKNQIDKKEAAKKIDGLIAVLQFVDRLDLSQRSETGQVTFTLRVQTALPLK